MCSTIGAHAQEVLILENNQSVMGFYILISLPTDKGVLQVPWPLQSPSTVHWKTNKE